MVIALDCHQVQGGIKVPHSLILCFLSVEWGPMDPMQLWVMVFWDQENSFQELLMVAPSVSEWRDQLGTMGTDCLKITVSGKCQLARFSDPREE